MTLSKPSNKEKLLRNPLLPILKLSYRPKRILRNVYQIDDSFDSAVIETDKFYKLDRNQTYTSKRVNNPRIFCIKNGVVMTDNVKSDCFMTKKRELINEITFSYGRSGEVDTRKNSVFQRYYLAEPILKVEGNLFSLLSGGGGNNNYYHWLFDTLPRLKLLMESPYESMVTHLLIPNLTAKYKSETFEFFDLGLINIIDSTKYPHVTAENVLATSHPNKPVLQAVPRWICQFLRDTFIIDQSKSVERRILVSRKNASKRRISNEDELYNKLAPYGFERIFLEKLSFRDQVKAFSQANIIISPHGAGLANLVFSTIDAQIIEIYPPNSNSYIYESISKIQKLRYSSITGVFRDDNRVSGDLHADFIIDVDKILKLAKLKG